MYCRLFVVCSFAEPCLLQGMISVMMRLALGVLRSTTNKHNGGHTAGCGVRLGRALLPWAPEGQWLASNVAAYFLAPLAYLSVCFCIYLPLRCRPNFVGLCGSKAALSVRSGQVYHRLGLARDHVCRTSSLCASVFTMAECSG